MMKEMKEEHYSASVDDFAKALVGHTIVAATEDTLTLEDGTTLEIVRGFTGPGGRYIGFFVPGIPVTEGSTKAVGKRRNGSIIITHDNEQALRLWREKVRQAALLQAKKAGWVTPLDQAVKVFATFYLPKPERTRFADLPAGRPDLDKLQRAVGDALAALGRESVLREDGRITSWDAQKRWAGHAGPGVDIIISTETKGTSSN